MAQTRALLNAQNIDEFIESVDIEKGSFTPDGETKPLDFNRLKITLTDGEVIYPKMDKDIKGAIYYCIIRDQNKD